MKLLIISELNNHISIAAKIAIEKGAKVTFAQNCDNAIKHINQGGDFDLVMIDVKNDVAEFINRTKKARIALNIVACGICADSQIIVEAIKAGAEEYIPLPPEAEMIAAIITNASKDEHRIVGKDENMQKIINYAQKIAPSDAGVIITGESGVGKEVMAKFIHQASGRQDKPFISINCAAIPEQLLESELFGHEKGAFTGAENIRIGKFEAAKQGTIMLDEISEMDIRLQAKILRVLQEKTLNRVGGNKTIDVKNVRVIAATNCDLNDRIKKGLFRQDLLFRLNVINIHIPPLRERKKDLVMLTDYFVVKYAKNNNLPNKPQITQSTRRIIENYSWPGNIRELENAIHRAVLISNQLYIDDKCMLTPDGKPLGEIDVCENKTINSLFGQKVVDVERKLIIETLSKCTGNRTHAAQILGISIRTLRNKIKQYKQQGLNITPARHNLDEINETYKSISI